MSTRSRAVPNPGTRATTTSLKAVMRRGGSACTVAARAIRSWTCASPQAIRPSAAARSSLPLSARNPTLPKLIPSTAAWFVIASWSARRMVPSPPNAMTNSQSVGRLRGSTLVPRLTTSTPYGFSGKPTEPGWGAARVGRAWVELMKRLGYAQFVAAGGDWGGIVVDVMAAGPDAPAELVGIHSTFPGVFPDAIEKAIQTHGELPSDLSAAERRAVDTLTSAYGYAGQAEMAWHPQTLFGLADSPVALAAWLLDHDPISYETLVAPAFVDGREGGLTRDDILDNTTMFWLTNTGVSASRIYWEHKASWAAVRNVTVPVAVSVFPDDVVYAPRSWTEQAYPNLVHYNEVDRGGHFAAWEQPELYASELRDGFRSLR